MSRSELEFLNVYLRDRNTCTYEHLVRLTFSFAYAYQDLIPLQTSADVEAKSLAIHSRGSK